MEKIDHNSLFVIIGDVKDQASIKIVTPLVRGMIPFWKAPSRKSLEQNKILFLLRSIVWGVCIEKNYGQK